MIFKEFCPSQTNNIIKDNPGYNSVLNNPLNITDEISKSMHEPILETYPYLSIPLYLAIMMNTRQ